MLSCMHIYSKGSNTLSLTLQQEYAMQYESCESFQSKFSFSIQNLTYSTFIANDIF